MMRHAIRSRARRQVRGRGRRLLSPLLAALALAPIAGLGCAELGSFPFSIPGIPGLGLDEETVAAGLREALDVGSQRAAGVLARKGAFSDDPVLRLSLPAEFENLGRALRAIGFGSQVDALELSMNRAAEQAVGEAVPIFASAARSMTIADAFEILNGSETAATQYFRRQTSEALRDRFTPIAQNSMRKAGLYRAYQDVAAQVQRIPFATMPAPDLESYVTDHALDALFTELASEEAKIRADPAARTTDLLRRVFGR